jgi:hypothetical protein
LGRQQLGDADAVVELGPDAAAAGADDLAAVTARVDVVRNGRCPAGRPTTRTISSATSPASWPPGKIVDRACVMPSRSVP